MKRKSHLLSKLIAVIIGVPVVALIAFVLLFDANKVRPKMAVALSQQLGRTVKLDGPIHLGFSINQGFQFSIKDVSVANPSWASRPVMAKVGTLELGVALRPLLHKKVDVTSFKLADADVQLETSAAGQNNWDFQTAPKKEAAPKSPAAQQQPPQAAPAQLPAFHVNKVALTDCRFAMRGADGKTSVMKLADLTFVPKGGGMTLKMEGEANGTPVTLDLTGEKPLETILKAKWPFEAEAHYAKFDLKLKGTLDAPNKQLADAYELASGDSKITGQMAIAYGGARPVIKGTVNSDKLDPSDFKMASAEAKGEPKAEAKKTNGTGQDRVFSTEPLQFDGLKALDAHVDVKIGELVIGPSAVKSLQTKLDLANGRLLLSPFKTLVGDKPIEGQIKLDAEKKPLQVLVMLKAYQIDLAKIVRLSGLSSFIESKGDADMDITTSGNSMHDLASNANGQINLVMAGGSVSEQEAGSIATDLLNTFSAGAGSLTKPGLNCMVAHLKLTNGQMETQGLLIDTAQATILGTGGANLRDETLNMLLRTRTKVIDVSGLTPPLRIGGTLANPSYKADVAGSVDKVKNLLMNGTMVDSAVPDIIQQAGQNACEYTLKHPQPAKTSTNTTSVKNAVTNAKDKVKDVGNKLIKGLFGQ